MSTESETPPRRNQSLALSLASSELGFSVHAGFMDALTSEAGIHPGHIGAASSGSYVGGLYSAGIPTSQIREILASKEMQRSFLEWRGPLRGMGMIFNLAGYTGLLTGNKAVAFLKKHLGDRRIEECERAEFTLSVTNLSKGCSEIIRHGPLAEFIVASCSVPMLFRGRTIGGNLFCDGAISDSSPFYHFVQNPDIDRIIVHTVRHAERHLENIKPLTIAQVFGQAHQIITDRFLDLHLECALSKGKKVIVLTSIVPRYRWGKRGTAKLLFDAGRETVLNNLETIRNLLS
jgi:predicted acylesterase/phospholipase RssA